MHSFLSAFQLSNLMTMKNKVENILLVLICILLPWMFYISIGDTLVNISVADAVFVIAGIYILIGQSIAIYQWKRKGKEKPVLLQKRTLFTAGYFLLLVLSLIVSHFAGKMDPKLETVSHITLVLEIVKTLIMAGYFFIGYILIKDTKKYKLALYATVFGSIPAAAVGFLAYVYKILEKPFFLKQFDLDMGQRFTGSFQDPNLCALYFLMVFYLGLYLFKAAKSRIIAWAMGITSVIALVVIMLTMSRGGWLALAISFVLFLALEFKRLRKETILFAIIILISVFSVIQLDLRFLDGDLTYSAIERIESALYQEMDADRIRLAKAAIRMGNEHFVFGVGKGNYVLNKNLYLAEEEAIHKLQIPHNTIISFYSQQGIVGVFIFLLLPAYIAYCLLIKRSIESRYAIVIITVLIIVSLSLNIENIRFAWFALGLFFVSVTLETVDEQEQQLIKNIKVFIALCSMLLLVFLVVYYETARRLPANIFLYNGKVVERKVKIKEPGVYHLTFDIHTDNNLHKVEIYEQGSLVDTLSFNNAYGYVNQPIEAKKELTIKFISNEDGWMRLSDVYLKGQENIRSLQDYIFIPEFLEVLMAKKELLVHSNTSQVKHVKLGDGKNEVASIGVEGARVIKYSNLTTLMILDFQCKEKMESIYQIDLRLQFRSIIDLLANELQQNLHSYFFGIYPATNEWEIGKRYNTRIGLLLSTSKFQLYGRLYDYTNSKYCQDTFFPISYELEHEDYEISDFGIEDWINIWYPKDNENRIMMSYNKWMETKRYDLEPGVYNIVFSAQGSFFDGEFSKLRIRDSYLNEVDSFFVDDEMKTYIVKYTVEQKLEGVSFLLEMVNYKAGESGNRLLYIEPRYEIVKE